MTRTEVKDLHLVRPEILNATITGITDEKGNPLDFGWSPLEKLRQIVNHHRRKFGLSDVNDGRDLFRLYGLLNEQDRLGNPKVTWTNFTYTEYKGDAPPQDFSREGLHVPSRWASKVTKVAQEGIGEIVTESQATGITICAEAQVLHKLIGRSATQSFYVYTMGNDVGISLEVGVKDIKWLRH